MIDFNFNENCYGCKNCENICPKKAIKITENEEGFLLPKIDKEKCVNCGLCDQKCPYTNFKEYTKLEKNIWYSCYLKDINERIKSTSGGIFPVLAKYFLENSGLVCGCIWDEDMKPIHILTSKKEQVEKMRGSKYLQSDLKEVAKQIKEQVNDKIILFTGTPCQIAAIKLYVGEHKNLYTCGLICEGAGPYKVWKKYVNVLEKKYKSKMINASFRNKEIGWDSPVARYDFDNGKNKKTLSYSFDKYVKGFLQGLYYRNSCNNCQYKGDGHNSDIIIGDLWGASHKLLKDTQYKGVSAIILNSDKGKKLFDIVKEDFAFEPIDSNKVINHNKFLMKPINKNKNRNQFFNQIDKISIIKNIEKNTYGNNFKRLMKELLYKVKIFKLVKRLKGE